MDLALGHMLRSLQIEQLLIATTKLLIANGKVQNVRSHQTT